MAENPKQYDQAFKLLSDTDPRGLLDVLGVLPASVEATVEALPRDIAARPLVVDAGYFVRPVDAGPFIAVFEALTSWKQEIGARLAAYGALLGDRYKMPVRMYVLPLAENACPRQVPPSGRVVWGDVEVVTALRWILPWKIDAGLLLAKASATLNPWVVLFDHSKPQLEEAITRLARRSEDAALFRILGGLRYRESVEWISLLGRIDRMITREMMRQSLAVQEWLNEGRDEGRDEGRVQGRVEGGRSALRTFLAKRFPQLTLDSSIQSIDDVEVLGELISLAAEATNADTISRAVRMAAGH